MFEVDSRKKNFKKRWMLFDLFFRSGYAVVCISAVSRSFFRSLQPDGGLFPKLEKASPYLLLHLLPQ